MTHVKALSVAEAFMNKLKGYSKSIKRIFDSPLVRYAREGASYSLLAISYSKLMLGQYLSLEIPLENLSLSKSPNMFRKCA